MSSGREAEFSRSHIRRDLGVYSISVVVELTGLGAGTLRSFERVGLLAPARTTGGTRRYSDDDLARLSKIVKLMEEGINLCGISRILTLETENATLRAENAALRSELGRAAPDQAAPDQAAPDQAAHHQVPHDRAAPDQTTLSRRQTTPPGGGRGSSAR
ncbi:MAG: MerR family transcriptional regulator [Micromonosporaceae bacterium]|nr:MerR family transcriptional regulator [Micromonosporaceae bacterium]